jgi:uncharacterized protein YdeI (YjbR/CyaY-like superfamily)
MPAVIVNPKKIREFKSAVSFYEWLARHHDKEDELWIRIYKVDSGLETITPKEAVDVVLCWGWIDAVRKALDEKSYLQRYTPRRSKSIWSQLNVENVARLLEEGRMTEHGLKHVEAAKSDGRWGRAYARARDMKIPDDLQAAIAARPKAKEMLEKLSAQNRFALAFRMHHVRTESGRQKKIAAFVEMLERGDAIHPQRQKSPA